MRDTIILHTNEIVLKGANRPMFEGRLVDDVRAKLAGVGRFTVMPGHGSMFVRHDGPMSAAQEAAATEALRRTFGIAWFLFAARVAKDIDAIAAAAIASLAGHAGTFKVYASRSDKKFPLNSQEIGREVGARVLDAVSGLAVDIREPSIEVYVEVQDKGAYVSVGRTAGPGGLPMGVSGNAVALLSGGIDSPVAAWKVMRRGARTTLAHFHSYPYVGRESIEKVKRLAATLAGYQGETELVMVPLGDIQREIVAKADPSLRVLLYRRMMLRIAERLARQRGALALITGESIGQVASQTLENISAVSSIAQLPIFRPLIGDDKEQIIRVARTIGTYETSIEPHDDCCSLFLPPRPATRSDAARLDAEEARYDVEGLVAAAMAAAETERITIAVKNGTVAARTA